MAWGTKTRIPLGVCSPPSLLSEQLKKKEAVVYTDNGNRSTNGHELLRTLEPLLPKLGISRVADISSLEVGSFPVFQTVRPHLFTHSISGQNTGSQGKGTTAIQAQLSCIMEGLETYCAEPKELHLIRGSYKDISKSHLAINPQAFLSYFTPDPIQLEEPIMWEEVYSVELDDCVMIPAQLIYFPFHPYDYNCRFIYPPTSNGLASGATYLEAVIHALYETIERHYMSWEQQDGNLCHELLLEDSLSVIEAGHVSASEFRLFITLLPDVEKDLPFVVCQMRESKVVGYGCSSNLRMSIERAVSECLQSHATVTSGSREDLSWRTVRSFPKRFTKKHQVDQIYRESELSNQIINRGFITLQEEYQFIRTWLTQQGFNTILIANLTRRGIDIPVVKTIIPGLGMPIYMRGIYEKGVLQRTEDTIVAYQYPTIRTQE